MYHPFITRLIEHTEDFQNLIGEQPAEVHIAVSEAYFERIRYTIGQGCGCTVTPDSIKLRTHEITIWRNYVPTKRYGYDSLPVHVELPKKEKKSPVAWLRIFGFPKEWRRK